LKEENNEKELTVKAYDELLSQNWDNMPKMKFNQNLLINKTEWINELLKDLGLD